MTPSPWNGIGGSQKLASFGVREKRFAPRCAIYQLCDLTQVSSPLWPQAEMILELASQGCREGSAREGMNGAQKSAQRIVSAAQTLW